jgi:hypothetical protein
LINRSDARPSRETHPHWPNVRASSRLYFDIWVSAADKFNQISFYSGSHLVAAYNVRAGLAAIAALPDASQYFGNPNNGEDSGEPFAYLNFIWLAGTTFTSVVLANSGTTASEFESDNWSVSSVAPSSIPGVVISGVPEPSSLVPGGIACVLGFVVTIRRNRFRAAHPARNTLGKEPEVL